MIVKIQKKIFSRSSTEAILWNTLKVSQNYENQKWEFRSTNQEDVSEDKSITGEDAIDYRKESVRKKESASLGAYVFDLSLAGKFPYIAHGSHWWILLSPPRLWVWII